MTPVKAQRVVFLAFTDHNQWPQKQLLKIYRKTSYQLAYDWLADIAERHGNAAHPLGQKYPAGGGQDSHVMAQVINPKNGQRWWIERHEVF